MYTKTIGDNNQRPTSGESNNEMNLAWQFIAKTNVSVFLTGKAGTGKTTFLKKLRDLMPKRMIVLAPTGVAAINAGGQTIHSFFQLPLCPFVPGMQPVDGQNVFRMNERKKCMIRTLDLLVIDEVSMVRADLLDQIDDVLRRHRDRTKPFGGVQLLLIGDLMQLSPVTKPGEWTMLEKYYDTPYFFSSHSLKQIEYVTVELKRIYRQQNADFVELLAKVRGGNLDTRDVDMLNSRYIPGFVPNDVGWIRLTTHNEMANRYNNERLAGITGPEYVFEAETTGEFPEYCYPIEKELRLRVGAQVMFVKNDNSPAHEYFNGKIGTVRKIAENFIEVVCEDSSKPIEVTKATWENNKYTIDPVTKSIKDEVVGTFVHYPLRLAWAITVHKSQGLTFDRAILDINQSFAHGQVYVALSRCRTLEGLILSAPVSLSSVISDHTVNAFIDDKTRAISEAVGRLPQMMMDYALSLLDELYKFEQIHLGYKWLERVVDEHLSIRYPRLLEKLRRLEPPYTCEISSVAYRFGNQYRAMMTANGGKITDKTLQERISKSCAYFEDKLKTIFGELLEEDVVVNIDNKQLAETYNNAVNALKANYKAKLRILEIFKERDFSVSDYLNAKAKILLDDELPQGAKAKGHRSRRRTDKVEGADATPKKNPKRPKGSTVFDTLNLLRDGMSLDAVARKRGLALSTIYTHISKLVEMDEVSVDDIVPSDRQKSIRDAASEFESSFTVTELKEKLPDDFTYGEIKLVLMATEP